MIYAIVVFAILAIVLFSVAIAIYLMKRWGMFVPAYVQAVQVAQSNERKLLVNGRQEFAQHIYTQINALHASSAQKSALYAFVMNADAQLMSVIRNESLPVVLSGVRFGAMTVTFRLKLREHNLAGLNKLMKMGNLIAQALGVPGARMISGAGFVDCEVVSNDRLPVPVSDLVLATRGTTVAAGVDSNRKPATIDISQHGLIAAIAPSRRGKTQAIRTMLYLLKRANPSLNIAVVAFKTADWQAFENDAAIIIDPDEINRFQEWLVTTLYARAKRPSLDRWVVVFDDLINLLAINDSLQDTVKQCASLGAGTGITTIVSTQYSGKSSGGTDIFANATARLLFKPSSNSQGARDGGMAGLGLDDLSEMKGDALLVVDGASIRVATAMIPDSEVAKLGTGAPHRQWLSEKKRSTLPTTFEVHPFESAIERLNGWLTDEGTFNWDEGKFVNRSEALRRLGWSNNGRGTRQLNEFESYIAENVVARRARH